MSDQAPGETKFRVFVEKIEWGWVTVTAPDEQVARDRAQDVAMRDRWYPERSHAHTSEVVKDTPNA